ANEIARALISMMARSTGSNQRPNTLTQDRISQRRPKPLAPHGRTIHWVESRVGAVAWGPLAIAPFPIPAHQTGRADFRHPPFRLASPQGTRRPAAHCRCRATTPRLVTVFAKQ